MYYVLFVVLGLLFFIRFMKKDSKGSALVKLVSAIALAALVNVAIWLIVKVVAWLFWPLVVAAVVVAVSLAVKKYTAKP